MSRCSVISAPSRSMKSLKENFRGIFRREGAPFDLDCLSLCKALERQTVPKRIKRRRLRLNRLKAKKQTSSPRQP